MDAKPFAGLLDRMVKEDSRKVQCATFLAQSCIHESYYTFSLAKGHVFSADLDQDRFVFRNEWFAAAADYLLTIASATPATRERFSQCFERFLAEDVAVVEAAATGLFYETEALGDPLLKLRWFAELPEEVRTAAEVLRAA